MCSKVRLRYKAERCSVYSTEHADFKKKQLHKRGNCCDGPKRLEKNQELWCYVVRNMSCVLVYVTYVPNFIFMYFMYIIYVFDLCLDYMCDIILIHVVHARVSLDVMYIQHTLRYQPCRGTGHYSDSGPQAHGRETWGQVICYIPPLPREKNNVS